MRKKWLGWKATMLMFLVFSVVGLVGILPVEAVRPERWVIIMYDDKGDPWMIEHNKSFMARMSEDGPVYACLQTKIYNTPENEIYESRTWVNTRDYSYRVEWLMTWRDGQIIDEGSGTADFKAPLPEGSNASTFYKRSVSYVRVNHL